VPFVHLFPDSIERTDAMVKPIPDGYHSITPYLIVRGASEAIDFYKRAFGAKEVMRLGAPGDRIGHAELQMGDSRIMMADEHPEMNALAPQSPGSSGVGICLYVPNVDDVVQQAIDAGATVEKPLANQFYGDRSATLTDPFGHKWTIATHIEDVTQEEIDRRMLAMMNQT
jgi:PhnB protein